MPGLHQGLPGPAPRVPYPCLMPQVWAPGGTWIPLCPWALDKELSGLLDFSMMCSVSVAPGKGRPPPWPTLVWMLRSSTWITGSHNCSSHPSWTSGKAATPMADSLSLSTFLGPRLRGECLPGMPLPCLHTPRACTCGMYRVQVDTAWIPEVMPSRK